MTPQRRKPATLGPHDTLATAVQRVRDSGLGMAPVVGRGERLLGVVTDAALRRAVLAGRGLQTPVEQVMSSRHPTIAKGARRADAAALLLEHRLRAAPVVDGNRLTGARSLDEVGGDARPAPVAVVMVGGRGQRLRPLTDKVPKPLLRIGGQTIVERIIAKLAEARVERVYLTLNYKAEQFEERLGTGEHLGVTIEYVRERQALGTAGALSLLPDGIDAPILVTNGDLVTTVDFGALFDFHWHHAGAITVTGVEHLTHVPYGVLRTVEHHLLAIDEKPQRNDFVSAGMYVLEPEILRYVPPDTPWGMPDLIADVVAEGLPVHVFPVLERWFDIGSPEEFERVLVDFATGEEE